MQKFNVVLEEIIRKETIVVVEVRDEDELSEFLEEADEVAEDYGSNSEDYISELKQNLKVIEIIEGDEELKEFECTDYYRYTEEQE